MLSNTSISSNRYPLELLKAGTSSTADTSNDTQASALKQSGTQTQLSPDQVLSAMSLSRTSAATLNQQAINTLKKPPFSPTNTNLLTPQIYSEATPMEPAAPKPYTVASLKQQLTNTFNKRFNGNKKTVRQALALFSDKTITKAVPDPRLRAALVSLRGTPGQASIAAIKNGEFKEVVFADLDMEGPAIGISVTNPDQTKSILMNSRYQHEDFRVLGPTIMHETLHTDVANSGREERINSTLDTMVYGKIISEFPGLAQSGTEYTRRYNTRLMAVLNSRNENGQLRPYSADRGNIFPGGGIELQNYGAAFTPEDGQPLSDSSPGNSTLQKVLRGVTGVSVAYPNFDANTDSIIDQNQAMFSPVALVNMAKILKLDTVS